MAEWREQCMASTAPAYEARAEQATARGNVISYPRPRQKQHHYYEPVGAAHVVGVYGGDWFEHGERKYGGDVATCNGTSQRSRCITTRLRAVTKMRKSDETAQETVQEHDVRWVASTKARWHTLRRRRRRLFQLFQAERAWIRWRLGYIRVPYHHHATNVPLSRAKGPGVRYDK